MYNCSKCKEAYKEKEQISSRYHSLFYASEDYDKRRGKGAFKKKYPDSVALMDALLDRKTKLIIDHAKHEPIVEDDDAPQAQEAPVRVI